MPQGMGPVAEAEWKRLSKQLKQRGTLTTADATAMEVHCITFARWKAACSEVEKYGEMIDEICLDKNGEQFTRRVVNPMGKQAVQLGNSVRAMLKEFSATPASRDKAKRAVPPVGKQQYPEGSVGWIEQNRRERLRAEHTAAQPVQIEPQSQPTPVVEPLTPEQEAELTNFEA